jgi:hypothetical protein
MLNQRQTQQLARHRNPDRRIRVDHNTALDCSRAVLYQQNPFGLETSGSDQQIGQGDVDWG